jgi:hypothetical protein
MRMEYINICKAQDIHWNKYFEFYQNYFLPPFIYKSTDEYRDIKLKQVQNGKIGNYIFCNEHSCNANAMWFNEDVKNKTLDLRINLLAEHADDVLINSIAKFLQNLLKEKTGLYFDRSFER